MSLWRVFADMVIVTESKRKNSLNFKMERRVMHLRYKGMSCNDIRFKVKNMLGKPPSKEVVRTTIRDFDDKGFDQRNFKYHRCGRKAWKMTPEVKKFTLLVLICTNRFVYASLHVFVCTNKPRTLGVDGAYICRGETTTKFHRQK